MRPLLWFILAIFTSTSTESVAQNLQVLVTQFPPFVDANADDGGIAWSALSDFASAKGVQVSPVYRPTARIFSQVDNNNWQASLVSIPLTPNVAVVEYSNAEVSYGVFTNDPSVTALTNLKIATIRTNSRSGFQKELEMAGAAIVEVDSLEQGYRMIRAGRVDAVLGVGIDGVAIGAPNPEALNMSVQLAVLPFTVFINMNTPQGREAVKLLTQ
ncbi:hypothetical protein [Saccharospirillum alexandrii]|uniref:hypothetical protein n=1 Tax=Saccharospirillum alexandrii TaxID=2448477 RepID=UPI0037359ADA